MPHTQPKNSNLQSPVDLRDVQLIQGGMGIAVSDWKLARAVAETGQLGVVSGTAIHVVFARRLIDGDPGGHMRRALMHFPIPHIANAVLQRWFCEEGRDLHEPYPQIPMFGADPLLWLEELNVVASFCEVYLAKEGHNGPVGLNLLAKVQPPTISSLFGAMLAGVDVVIMGAGIPAQIPALLQTLSLGGIVRYKLDVEGATEAHAMSFDTARFGSPALKRPMFLAIVSSLALANYLLRDESIRPDGFVVEGPTAGGHNAPPRSKASDGSPAYGPKDEIDLNKLRQLGLPFWLAGGKGTHEALVEALQRGAQGVQVGTAFALCRDSGFDPEWRSEVVRRLHDGALEVNTDFLASSSGYPFKVANIPGTLSDANIVTHRERVCDVGLLREIYERPNGMLGYRCSAEPVVRFVRKGGEPAEAVGRRCLCNGLLSAAGFPQIHNGEDEPPIITLGTDLDSVRTLMERFGPDYTAVDVVESIVEA